MGRKKRARKSKLGPEKEPRPWRPTNRQALWAIGLVVALVTITLLVANLYPAIWQDLSRERVAKLIGIGVALVVVIVLLAIGGASRGWTGFGDKTLWDWVQLLSALAIPVVITIAGFWFTAQQNQSQQHIENQRADRERELEEQRAQDEALQAYLDQMSTQMSTHLLEKNLQNPAEDLKAELAQARTLTVLGRLGPDRKRTVIEFLYKGTLIHDDAAALDLNGANLREASLNSTNLINANLSSVDLSNADLRQVNLRDADLSSADLSSANLREANLSSAT